MSATTPGDTPFRVAAFPSARAAHDAIEALLAAGLSRDELAVVCEREMDVGFSDIPHPAPHAAHPHHGLDFTGTVEAVIGGIAMAAATLASGGLAAVGEGAVLVGGGAIHGVFTGAGPRHDAEHELWRHLERAMKPGHVLVAAHPHGGDGARLALAERLLAAHGGVPADPEG